MYYGLLFCILLNIFIYFLKIIKRVKSVYALIKELEYLFNIFYVNSFEYLG